jgi:hypothetical protein
MGVERFTIFLTGPMPSIFEMIIFPYFPVPLEEIFYGLLHVGINIRALAGYIIRCEETI